jgi:hypothetical protein
MSKREKSESVTAASACLFHLEARGSFPDIFSFNDADLGLVNTLFAATKSCSVSWSK